MLIKKGLLAILTDELFHIILLQQKSCSAKKEFLKIKVHPDFDKFSEEVLHDIMSGSVFFFQVPKKN